MAQAVEKKMGDIGGTEGQRDIAGKDREGQNTTMEDYFLALFLAGDRIIAEIAKILEPEDFLGERQRLFWGKIRDIINRLQPKNTAKIIGSLPKDFNDFVDQLSLINISPAFSEEELWAQETFQVGRRIKRKSLARQLLQISDSLKEAQRKKDNDKILMLTTKFNKLSEKLREVREIT
ncbi:hypothetical protein HYW40_01365 [Candidatus Curtissbacteria bacterium]|nr:hypothetical protein [Candidatus Curtissbacteria bacterium]